MCGATVEWLPRSIQGALAIALVCPIHGELGELPPLHGDGTDQSRSHPRPAGGEGEPA